MEFVLPFRRLKAFYGAPKSMKTTFRSLLFMFLQFFYIILHDLLSSSNLKKCLDLQLALNITFSPNFREYSMFGAEFGLFWNKNHYSERFATLCLENKPEVEQEKRKMEISKWPHMQWRHRDGAAKLSRISSFSRFYLIKVVQREKTGKSPFSEISGNDPPVLYFREIPFLGPKTTSKEHAVGLYAKLKRSLSPELVFGAFRWSAFEGFEGFEFLWEHH